MLVRKNDEGRWPPPARRPAGRRTPPAGGPRLHPSRDTSVVKQQKERALVASHRKQARSERVSKVLVRELGAGGPPPPCQIWLSKICWLRRPPTGAPASFAAHHGAGRKTTRPTRDGLTPAARRSPRERAVARRTPFGAAEPGYLSCVEFVIIVVSRPAGARPAQSDAYVYGRPLYVVKHFFRGGEKFLFEPRPRRAALTDERRGTAILRSGLRGC